MCRREDPGTRFGLNVPRIDALPRKLQDVSTEKKDTKHETIHRISAKLATMHRSCIGC